MLSDWRSSSRHRSQAALAIVLLGACALQPPEPSLAGESSSTSVADNDVPPEMQPDGGVLEDGAPSRAGGLFLAEPDGGVGDDCSIFDQDCPLGEKCNAHANDGGGSWNATKCFPIDPDPDDIGEPCTVVGSGVSGLDSCVLGAMCWNVDPETNLGECVGLCNGSEANPICTDPTLHCVGRVFMICLPSCCPLEQSCHPGEGCYPAYDTFECVPDAGGDEGVIFDTCEFLNVCDPGLFCADSDRVPGCEGSIGCCTPYCELGSSTCEALHPDLECIPWFEEGHAPFGEEHVGGCMLPE